jgi:hypothetical protein
MLPDLGTRSSQSRFVDRRPMTVTGRPNTGLRIYVHLDPRTSLERWDCRNMEVVVDGVVVPRSLYPVVGKGTDSGRLHP